MKEITAYQCQCGEIYKCSNSIYICKHCGKEICTECSGYEYGLCWECNDEYCEKLDKIESTTFYKTEEHRKQVIAEFEESYKKLKEQITK